MNNTVQNQVDLTYQAAHYLFIGLQNYRNATHAWCIIEETKLAENYTQKEYENYHEERSLFFNRMQATMKKARRYHDLYMAEESKLNQMGRMKKDGF